MRLDKATNWTSVELELQINKDGITDINRQLMLNDLSCNWSSVAGSIKKFPKNSSFEVDVKL